LRRLAAADAYGSMGIDRQRAVWVLKGLHDTPMPLFERAELQRGGELMIDRDDEEVALPVPSPAGKVSEDYGSIGLSLKAHPVSFVRERLRRRGVAACEALSDAATMPTGTRAAVAGLVLVRQRPGTAKGVTFLTVEDETGIANIIVHTKVYEKYRAAVRHSTGVIVHGRVERKDGVVHVLARRVETLDKAFDSALAQTAQKSRDFH
jgi:error-prone DNA polymerase